jgi:hypothetical protein
MQSFQQFFSWNNAESLALVAALAFAWWMPLIGDRWLSALERALERLAMRKRLAIVVAFLLPILVRVSLLPILPIRPPGVHDEFSYLLAADTFAHGRLANPPHPMWVFLDTIFVLQHPTYASIYPPAQGGILALGQILGHPWIGVILSMAAMFGALLWMLQGWFPPRWALLGATLPFLKFGIFSYWMNSYWGGAVAAIGGALLMGSLPRIFRAQRPLDAILMGLGIAILVNSRPYEGLVLCLPVAIAVAWWLFGKKSPAWRVKLSRVVLPVAVILLFTAAFSGYYNWRVTGDPFVFPHALHDKLYESVSSFVWNAPGPPMHYLNRQFDVAYNHVARNAFAHTWDDFGQMSRKKVAVFFEFFVGQALLVPFVAFPLLLANRRMRFLLFQFAFFCLGVLVVVWIQPHYVAPALATLFALLTQMFRYMRKWMYKGRPVGIGLTRAVILISVAAIPYNAIQMARYPPELYAPEWGLSNWPRARIAKELETMPGQQLVVVRYSPTHHDVNYEWVYNAADIDGSKVVWVREIPGMDIQPLLNYFKNRRVWLVEADASQVELEPYLIPSTITSSAPQH